MEPKITISITNISATGEITVMHRGCIVFNGEEMSSNHSTALNPGQFERAKEILPDNLYKAVEAIWTPEVIAAWEESLREDEPTPESEF